jgi:catechol 2,3-dioxygenase-like lactoylglutathione lyase family enzyme
MLDHIEIYVKDLEQTKRFWSWLLSELGYVLYQEWTEGFSYKYGVTYIVFVQTEQKYIDESYHRKHAGLNHLAFCVSSRQEVDRLTKLLKERHANILYEDRHPHAGGVAYYAAFFEDPNRIKVELVVRKQT